MKCAHPSCSCLEQSVEHNGRRYCSHHCAKKDREKSAAGDGCGCGHTGCD
jgi:Prokaryotic metallothionein